MRLRCLVVFIVAASFTEICFSQSPDQQKILALHEQARRAHLQGDAKLLADTVADSLVNVQAGEVETLTRDQLRQQFEERFRKVKYSLWEDVAAPSIHISPDGKMTWAVIQIHAKYRDRNGAALGDEHEFRSSWIATFEKQGDFWRMAAISSGVAGKN
jgi:ketosteroid isomerase-like protein